MLLILPFEKEASTNIGTRENRLKDDFKMLDSAFYYSIDFCNLDN